MIVRSSVSYADSQLKLEEIEKQLKMKIQKARQIVMSSCSYDQHAEKTQQELIKDLENLQVPDFNHHTNYSQQFWKIYLQNEISCAYIKEVSEKKNLLSQLITQIQNLQDEHYRLNRLKNRKKNRRLAAEIQKTFLCPYDKCHRIYGSDVSLNLHIKLKHNGGNKTDRQKLAQKICMAEQNSLALPPITLNLPPGYLRQYRKLYFQKDFNEADLRNLQNYEVKGEVKMDANLSYSQSL